MINRHITSETTYFHKVTRGSLETDETLKLAKKRAEELGIRSIVVASLRGETALKASNMFEGYNLVIVTRVSENSNQEFPVKIREEIEKKDGRVHHCSCLWNSRQGCKQEIRCHPS